MPTAAEIEAGRTKRGGWTRKQLAKWGVSWPPPKGWRRRLEQEKRASPRRKLKPIPVVRLPVVLGPRLVQDSAPCWSKWVSEPRSEVSAEKPKSKRKRRRKRRKRGLEAIREAAIEYAYGDRK